MIKQIEDELELFKEICNFKKTRGHDLLKDISESTIFHAFVITDNRSVIRSLEPFMGVYQLKDNTRKLILSTLSPRQIISEIRGTCACKVWLDSDMYLNEENGTAIHNACFTVQQALPFWRVLTRV